MAVQRCGARSVGGGFDGEERNELEAIRRELEELREKIETRKEVKNLRKEIERLSALLRNICSEEAEEEDNRKEDAEK